MFSSQLRLLSSIPRRVFVALFLAATLMMGGGQVMGLSAAPGLPTITPERGRFSVPADQICPDAISIREVQGPGASTPLTQAVTIHGYVTAVFGSELVVQEMTTTVRSGVLVFSSGHSASQGDEVCVSGVPSERFGQTQVGGNSNPNAAIQILSSDNPLPDPVVVSTQQIATGANTAEDYEGMLVQVRQVRVTDAELGFGEWAIDDGSGPTRADDLGSYGYSPQEDDFLISVTGPLFYSFNNYKIQPRSDRDIGLIVINEVDADQPGTDVAEFVELYDGGVGNSPLDGLSIVLFNGNGDVSYAAFDLSGQQTDEDGYFVLCGNAENVSGCGLEVSPATNLIQNGPDAVALFQAQASAFPNGTPVTTTNLIDALVYDNTASNPDEGLLVLLKPEQPQVNEAGAGDIGHANQRCPNGSGGQRMTASFAQFAPTPGAFNECAIPGPVKAKIHEIQGSGPFVTAAGPFTVTAIVIGDFQGMGEGAYRQLDGFFMQERDEDQDGDPLTSEGIFVYCGNPCQENVAVGDQVEVMGIASDRFGMSQIAAQSLRVISSGNPLPAATRIGLPGDLISATTISQAQAQIDAYFEPYEGMLVTISDTLAVAEYFRLSRYGEVVLTKDQRSRQFTDANPPSVDGYTQHRIRVAANTLILDDDMDGENQALALDLPVFHPRPGFSVDSYIRGGDVITNLTGPLHYSFSAWRIRPVIDTFDYTFTPANPRTEAPAAVGGSLTVAGFNVLNYFTTLNQGRNICGPSGNMGCRGANSQAELERQTAKIVSALCAMDADIVGLMEIENNDFESLEALVDAVNQAACGPYAFVDIRNDERPTGIIGTDAIKVGFIYKSETVTLTGEAAILDSSVYTTFIDTKNRPALAQTFREVATDGEVTVVVNHLKSKGSACTDVTLYNRVDSDRNDGQANCNLTRLAAAEALADWLATDPTASGTADVLIIGDLNSYRQEDPITALKSAGYTDLADHFIGAGAYSYVFDGQLGYLDYALASQSLLPKVTGVSEWHINADEVNLLDYNDTIRDAGEASFEAKPSATELYRGDPYRSSDHDPIIVGLNLAPSQIWPLYLPLVEGTGEEAAGE
jgi:predicted extracellular nuclease